MENTEANFNWLSATTLELGWPTAEDNDCHINTCSHASLQIINLIDWHVAQHLGWPPLVGLASLLAPASKWSVLLFSSGERKTFSDEVTFVRRPLPKLLSGGKNIKLIYEWKSLSSVFWWPPPVTRWHKSLRSKHALLVVVHFNLMLLIS